MTRSSYGWQATPVEVFDTSVGPVRVSAHIQGGGAHAAWSRFVVRLPDGTWAAVQLDSHGAVVAQTRSRRTRTAAREAIEAALRSAAVQS